MRGFDIGDLGLGGHAIGLGFEHNCRAVSIIGTHIGDGMPQRFHRSHPNIGLNIFHQMPQMNRAIGIR